MSPGAPVHSYCLTFALLASYNEIKVLIRVLHLQYRMCMYETT